MSTKNDLAKRIRRSNKAYFAAGMEAGKQKVTDLFFVAAHELGMPKARRRQRNFWTKWSSWTQSTAWHGRERRNPTMQFTESI